VHSFALSPDTRSLLICTGTTVKAMDAAATKPLRRPSRDQDALPGAVWLGDDGYVFVTRDSYHFYNTMRGFGSSSALKKSVRSMVFSPDVAWGIALDLEGSASLYRIVGFGGMSLNRLLPDIDAACAAFSPDSKNFAVGGKDGAIHHVNGFETRGSESAAKKLTGHTGPVRALAYSPSGRRLFSAGSDKTARLWDLDTGKELQRYALPDAVHAVAYASDGRTAFSAGSDMLVRQWILPKEK